MLTLMLMGMVVNMNFLIYSLAVLGIALLIYLGSSLILYFFGENQNDELY